MDSLDAVNAIQRSHLRNIIYRFDTTPYACQTAANRHTAMPAASELT